MEVDDAMRLLGVGPGVSADEVRRAYLRRVKVTSPERDPEGFRESRAAFELLRSQSRRRDAGPDAASNVASVIEDARDEVTAGRPLDESVPTAAVSQPPALPDPAQVLREVLELHLAGRFDVASQRFLQWYVAFEAAGLITSLHDPELQAKIVSTYELSRCSDALPLPVRSIIARCLLDGRIAHAQQQMRIFALGNRDAVGSVLRLLDLHAPGLYAEFDLALRHPKARPDTLPGGARLSAWQWLLLIFFVASWAARACNGGRARTEAGEKPPAIRE